MGFEDAPGTEGQEPLRELRRSYHDRIAEVRELSLQVLRRAIAGAASATRVLLSDGVYAPAEPPCDLPEMRAVAGTVDAKVVEMLALQSPVARDLRMVLASRDVTQLSLLCVGLAEALGGRVERAAESLAPDLRRSAADMGAGTVALLEDAEVAWFGLDADRAAGLEASAQAVRAVQTDFIGALIALGGVPMDAALDLAMVARAYERLADHAVEVAERVMFVAQGT